MCYRCGGVDGGGVVVEEMAVALDCFCGAVDGRGVGSKHCQGRPRQAAWRRRALANGMDCTGGVGVGRKTLLLKAAWQAGYSRQHGIMQEWGSMVACYYPTQHGSILIKATW